MSDIVYNPPPTIKAFIKDLIPGALFYDWIIGPLGSGKTTGLFFKLVHMAKLQAPGPDKIRHTRAVIVRNTAPQLKDTTIASWNMWFQDGVAGTWKATERNFTLRFDDVECEVLFRPLDTEDDIARVLSLELTFAILDEFTQIKKPIVDALAGRVGRYPSAINGGPTNWGMWGSSNPDTEDNWWFDFLHDDKIVELITDLHRLDTAFRHGRNARYFHQPSGFSPVAENAENLAKDYYKNLAIGKTQAWIKQFIESQWGFSASGKPVIASFKPDLHIAKRPLLFQPAFPLVAGLDPGLEGTAMVFGQEDLYGRLIVLGELYCSGLGAQRFIDNLLKPFLRRTFPNSAEFIISPDPAADNRAQTDERTIVDVYKTVFGRECVKTESNNRLPLRLDAIEGYTTRLTDMGPALLIDAKRCPMLIRALGGGWRFDKPAKSSAEIKPVPEKNSYSHVGDAFGYLCRYFTRLYERGSNRGMTVAERRTRRPVAQNVPRYHFQ